MRLANKVAFITGGAAGIGRASSLLFAREGASVAIADFDAVQGAELAALIEGEGGRALFLHADVTDERSVQSAIAATVKQFGRLDVLMNNAGGSSAADKAVTESEPEEFWKVMKLNLFSTWLCCHYGIPEIIRSGGGSVINLASITAIEPMPGRHAYVTAKGGVISLTRAVAAQYAAQQVRVNALAPGFTASERIRAQMPNLPEEFRLRLEREHPLGLGEPENVAAFALFLASDESRYTSGQIFAVNNEIRI